MRVAAKLAAFESADDGVAIADLAARGVHEIGAALHLGEELAAIHLRQAWRRN